MKAISVFVFFMISALAFAQKSNSCIDAVLSIVSSSRSYKWATKGLEKRVVANGGIGFGTMVYDSPNPKRDGAGSLSKDYVIALHESYPDRMVNTRWYTFRPSNTELYEHDMVEDTLIKIKYDTKLLPLYKAKCLKK